MAITKALARALSERATNLSHSDIARRLNDALKASITEGWCYVMDIFGDDKSGDLVYCEDGDCYRASYKLSVGEGSSSATIDVENSTPVVPRTSYEQQGGARESAEINITGDVVKLREGAVLQDGTAYLKLIAPGWGSSGYYPSEVLERDGSKCFPKGTKNFWNHPTPAEEAARPEGDLNGVASVLTEDARYDASGPAGAGLYARCKVFEQFRQPVNELAPHIGMSIRAMGEARSGKAEGRSGQIIEKLTHGQSVDYVTEAGAGGKVLQLFEAARSPKTTTIPIEEGADMDAAELKKLQESVAANAAENRKLRERLALSDAASMGRRLLTEMSLPDAVRERILNRCVTAAPLTESGDLDATRFTELVTKEAKDEAAYIDRITGGATPRGMGAGPVETDPVKLGEAANKSAIDAFLGMGYDEKTAKQMVGVN